MYKLITNKLIIVLFLCVALTIPISMTYSTIQERSGFKAQASQSVAKSWTATQTLMGPVIILPFDYQKTIKQWDSDVLTDVARVSKQSSQAIVIADDLSITSDINNEFRQKGIYRIPVYSSESSVKGAFSASQLQQLKDEIEQSHEGVLWRQGVLSLGLTDPRGLGNHPKLTLGPDLYEFKAGSKGINGDNGLHVALPAINELINKDLSFSFQLSLRGMSRLSFVAAANEAEVQLTSDWPHPSFDGSFLPLHRTVTEKGYHAQWKVSSFASNIQQKLEACANGNCEGLNDAKFGVNHIEGVDIYLQASRSVKYGFLFVLLTFVTFLVFETMKNLMIHPVQYALVGLAIVVFFVLLIALSEHIEFLLSYVFAACACISIITYYVIQVLGNASRAFGFAALLASLYAMLYVIISAEDYAMLLGAVLIFITLSSIMVVTRNVDWYQHQPTDDDIEHSTA